MKRCNNTTVYGATEHQSPLQSACIVHCHLRTGKLTELYSWGRSRNNQAPAYSNANGCWSTLAELFSFMPQRYALAICEVSWISFVNWRHFPHSAFVHWTYGVNKWHFKNYKCRQWNWFRKFKWTLITFSHFVSEILLETTWSFKREQYKAGTKYPADLMLSMKRSWSQALSKGWVNSPLETLIACISHLSSESSRQYGDLKQINFFRMLFYPMAKF